MRPIVNGLKPAYQDKVDFIEPNFDDPANQEIIQKYHVPGHPSFIVLDRNGQVVARIIGGSDRDTLKAALDKAVQ